MGWRPDGWHCATTPTRRSGPIGRGPAVSAGLGLRTGVRGLVFAGLTTDVTDELAERVAQQVGTVVCAAAPQPPRGPAHGSGRPRCTGFECHHASMRLCGFLVRHYQPTRLAPAARSPQPPAGDGEAVQYNEVRGGVMPARHGEHGAEGEHVPGAEDEVAGR